MSSDHKVLGTLETEVRGAARSTKISHLEKKVMLTRQFPPGDGVTTGVGEAPPLM